MEILGVASVIAVIAVLAGLVLWLGFKLLFLPFRYLWWFGNVLTQQIGGLTLALLLLWTIALEPDPFIYLWNWFLRFGKALLIDAPSQTLPAITQLHGCSAETISNSIGECLGATGTVVYQLWRAALEPVRTFAVPPRIENAALVFAVGATAAATVAQFPWSGEGKPAGTAGRIVLALAGSFFFALYLAIIAIIAIPVFGQKIPELAPYRANLNDQLKQGIAAVELAQFPGLDALEKERQALPKIQSLHQSAKDTAPPGDAERSSATTFLAAIESFWRFQLDTWDQMFERLRQGAQDLPAQTRSFSQTTLQFFLVSDEGHIGEIPTQRHATLLANSFNLWIADYRAGIERCNGILRDDLARFRTLYGSLQSMASTEMIPISQISNLYRGFSLGVCGDIIPAFRSYLPVRSGPEETLGPFGAAAAWLLRTESPELALIIGLLGFGFFGALAASFVREFSHTPGYELPSIGFIVPALIRGIGAAILVFLLAKGGTAILTRGDASPNAYAIFLPALSRPCLAKTCGRGRAGDNRINCAARAARNGAGGAPVQARRQSHKRHPMTARQSRKSKRRPLAPAVRIGRHSEEKHLPSPPAAHWLHLPPLADQQR